MSGELFKALTGETLATEETTETDEVVVEKATDTEDIVEEAEEEFDPITYNGQEVKIPKSERKAYEQKGYHLPKVQAELEASNTALTRAAKLAGFDNVKDYVADLDKKETEALVQKVEDSYGDPEAIKKIVDEHPAILKAKAEADKLARDNDLRRISKNEYYDYVKDELAEIASTQPNVILDTAYVYLVGNLLLSGKLDSKVTEAKTKATKDVTLSMHDKARRSISSTGSASSSTATDTASPFVKKFGEMWGLSAEEMAKISKK